MVNKRLSSRPILEIKGLRDKTAYSGLERDNSSGECRVRNAEWQKNEY